MLSNTGTWSVGLALLVNAGIVVFLFLVIPAEVREKVFKTVEVSILDYRLPEMEEEPAYEPPDNESEAASEGAENASNTSTGRGTSSVENSSSPDSSNIILNLSGFLRSSLDKTFLEVYNMNVHLIGGMPWKQAFLISERK